MNASLLIVLPPHFLENRMVQTGFLGVDMECLFNAFSLNEDSKVTHDAIFNHFSLFVHPFADKSGTTVPMFPRYGFLPAPHGDGVPIALRNTEHRLRSVKASKTHQVHKGVILDFQHNALGVVAYDFNQVKKSLCHFLFPLVC